MSKQLLKAVLSGVLFVFGIVLIVFMHQLGELIEVGENVGGNVVYGYNIGFRGICILGTIGAVLIVVTGSILLNKRHAFLLLGFTSAVLDLGMLSYIRHASKTCVMLGENVDDKSVAWDRIEAIHNVGTTLVVILIIATLVLLALEYLRFIKISWKFERVFGAVLFGVVVLDLCLKAFTNVWYIGFVLASVGVAGFAVVYDLKKSKNKKFIFYLSTALLAVGMLVLVTDSVVNKVTSSKKVSAAMRSEALEVYEAFLEQPSFDWGGDGQLYSTERMRFSLIDIRGEAGVPVLVVFE